MWGALRDSLNANHDSLIDTVGMDGQHLADDVAGDDEAGVDLPGTGKRSTEDRVTGITEHAVDGSEMFCPFGGTHDATFAEEG